MMLGGVVVTLCPCCSIALAALLRLYTQWARWLLLMPMMGIGSTGGGDDAAAHDVTFNGHVA